MERKTDTTIVMADDDPDDYFLMKKALFETGIQGKLLLLSDGAELMDYLLFKGKYTDPEKAPRPRLILLDLNMPKMNGHEALKRIKDIDRIKDIPVIIFTTSKEDGNIQQCYQDGADEYIIKPSDYRGLLHVAYSIKTNWI